jgi:hypothetical protein
VCLCIAALDALGRSSSSGTKTVTPVPDAKWKPKVVSFSRAARGTYRAARHVQLQVGKVGCSCDAKACQFRMSAWMGKDGRRVSCSFLFWVAVTVVDLIGQGIASLGGVTLATQRPLQAEWAWVYWPAVWLGVGIGEEIAFRAYLHNKVVKVMPQRWLGIVRITDKDAFRVDSWKGERGHQPGPVSPVRPSDVGSTERGDSPTPLPKCRPCTWSRRCSPCMASDRPGPQTCLAQAARP